MYILHIFFPFFFLIKFFNLKPFFDRYTSSEKTEKDEKELRDLANSLCLTYGVKPKKELNLSLFGLVKESMLFGIKNHTRDGWNFLSLAISPFTSRVSNSGVLLQLFQEYMERNNVEAPEMEDPSYSFYSNFLEHLQKLSKNKKVRISKKKKKTKSVLPLIEFDQPTQASQVAPFDPSQASQNFVAPINKPPRAKRKSSNLEKEKSENSEKEISEKKSEDSKSFEEGENFLFSQSSQPSSSQPLKRKLAIEFAASQSSQPERNEEHEEENMEENLEKPKEDQEDDLHQHPSPPKKQKASQEEEILVPASQDEN